MCEDYFTMPFDVSDKSLHTSGKGSKEFDLLDGGEAALPSMDAMIHKVFSHEEPIVKTSQSFESLLPGKKSVTQYVIYAWNDESLPIQKALLLHIIQHLKNMYLRVNDFMHTNNGNCHELPYSSYEPVILEKD